MNLSQAVFVLAAMTVLLSGYESNDMLAKTKHTQTHWPVAYRSSQTNGPRVIKTKRTVPFLASAMLNVPIQRQFPQLPNGCEVTTLSMLLTAVGHPVSKMTLASREPRDPTMIRTNKNGTVEYWGDPNKGFVGRVDGSPGYGIYHGPLVKLINQIVPGRATDLTGHPFSDILGVVASGTPVEVWTISTFKPTSDWVVWNSPDGPVRATFWEHAVLLVGYNRDTLFVNDPINGVKAKPVNRRLFIAAWGQLGKQAITIKR